VQADKELIAASKVTKKPEQKVCPVEVPRRTLAAKEHSAIDMDVFF